MNKRLTLAVTLVVVACGPSLSATAADALDSLNVMRRSVGLYPLQRDPQLSSGAESINATRARMGRSGHLRGNGFTRWGARAEGVGYRSINDPRGYRFYACYSATRRYRYAGASAITTRRGTYYTLILR